MYELTRLRRILVDFMERATSKEATPEEIAALPGVAQAYVDSFRYDSRQIIEVRR